MLALYLGRLRHLSHDAGRKMIDQIEALPELLNRALQANDVIQSIAEKYHRENNFLYLGRQFNFPTALEGALKLKEISYIHAEGMPAAEMKHGPISLIDNSMPVVAIAPQNTVYEKMMSNISEVKAREGIVLAISSDSDNEIINKVDDVSKIPECSELLSPILTTIPLQLLSYYIAIKKGCDVDQPRNLAKSVTVE